MTTRTQVAALGTIKVAPCPFCGRQPEYGTRQSDVTATKEFHFLSCFCGTHSSHAWQQGDSKEDVAKRWNTRHQVTP